MDEFFPAPGPSNTKFDTTTSAVEDGIAIVATGNTHVAITAGQYVYVRGHGTLAEGMYVASSNIAANATLSSSNLTADAKGGLNALSEQITARRVAMSTTEYFQLAYDFSHRITEGVIHICCRLKVLSLPSSSDVNAITLPNGVTFDRYGLVIPVYKSSGEWSASNTIVYCYVGTNVLVVHKDDLAVGNYIYLDYTARVINS